MKTRHAINGDRVLVTVELGEHAVTGAGGEITLDLEDWQEINRRVGRERQHAERAMDADALSRRVGDSLQKAAGHALHPGQDPVSARRRAVAGVLHHLADMVQAGTVVDVEVAWPDEDGGSTAVLVSCVTRAQRDLEILIPLAIRQDAK